MPGCRSGRGSTKSSVSGVFAEEGLVTHIRSCILSKASQCSCVVNTKQA